MQATALSEFAPARRQTLARSSRCSKSRRSSPDLRRWRTAAVTRARASICARRLTARSTSRHACARSRGPRSARDAVQRTAGLILVRRRAGRRGVPRRLRRLDEHRSRRVGRAATAVPAGPARSTATPRMHMPRGSTRSTDDALQPRAQRRCPQSRSAGRSTAITVLSRDASGRAPASTAAREPRSASTDVTVRGTDLARGADARVRHRARSAARCSTWSRRAASFVFSGNGFGHGVGLCQAGALARVHGGETPRAVLDALLPRAPALTAVMRHRIHDEVDGELRVVLALESLVAPVVVPLAAVVLVAVEHAEPAAVLEPAQVVVDDLVAPAVQLVRRRRRAVSNVKKLR